MDIMTYVLIAIVVLVVIIAKLTYVGRTSMEVRPT